ncbi:hypothetical protein PV327_000433 [Microctonus hyperodae]|uniref:Uncharacterized protein n=1 Tax=Microctonus hyperodae TaxID=165561 RepID=A0AA39G664_MICHY|nr:hypothetical protein PV327_000433 [Microctonus hyperodae]
MIIITVELFISYLLLIISAETPSDYIKQCSKNDPYVKTCLINTIHHLRPYLNVGIPEIGLSIVEPFRLDKVLLTLTGGVNGYKIELTEVFIKGMSNFTIKDIKFGSKFEVIVTIPKLELNAKYTSSGVLIILPANSNGTFYSRFDHVESIIKGSASTIINNEKTYIKVDTLDVQLHIKNVFMHIQRNSNFNQIIGEASNLFLRENGREVLKAMEPQLKKKLSVLIIGIVNQLLRHVPVETFLLP